MSLRLADRSFQYPVGIAENMLIEVGKFTFPADFVIFEMEEDSKVPLILGRPFLHTTDASYSNDDTCFSIDVIDEILEEDFDALLDEEYVFLEDPSFLPVIISSQLSKEKKNKLVSVLKKHKEAFAWKTTDIPGIYPSFCKHKIQLLDDKKPVVQKQRILNPNIQEVVKKEIMKLLDTGNIYLIADSPWVSPIHCVPKKDGITVVTNKNDELVPTRTVTGWRVCIDYRKLNEATAKDHFPLPFMDQMLERLAGNKYFCFLDGFSGYFQIPIDPNDQEKTTFTCPFRTYAYRRMPFGLYNASATFQMCMLAIFHDMIEESIKVFMDDFSEKCHFMVKEGIVLGHKVSSAGLEVDKAKIDVISKLPPPTEHQSPNWNLPFELMCDAIDFAVGAILSYSLKDYCSHRSFSSKALIQKKDAKPRLIRWILLLQEFDIEIKDKKGTENAAADHLSRIEKDESSNDSEMDDTFPGETLMEINTKDEPWFGDFANYLVVVIIPKGMTYQQKNKFFSDLKHYFWEEPYLFKVCSNGTIRRCISGPETRTILDQCHHGPTSGHYGPNVTAKKVLDSGFYWTTIIKEAHTLVRLCEACQKTGNISKRDEMLLNNIQVSIDYVSKWAEAQALPTNDARVLITFLKKLFCRFGMPKALISDTGTRFCNKIMEKPMKRYGVNHHNPAIWSRKLDDALWAFRTAYKTPTGNTPYKLIYGKNCHLPFEIEHRAYWARKNCNPDLIVVGEKRMFQLHELDELRHQEYENSRLQKARTKVWNDRKLRMRKEFKQGNKVLLFHLKYKFKQLKLRSRWLGPYVVKHQYPSRYVKLYGKDGKTFIVNSHRLKQYQEEDNDLKEGVTSFFS
ncbi:reverse transcriptase domain-containing protein [Tanacetum coccineum]